MADRQHKTQQKLAETATDLTTVGIYLAGYWLLLVIGYSLIYLLLFNVFADNLETVLPQQQGYSTIQYDIGTPTLIVSAILQSIWGTFSLATVGASIHVVARWVLVGSGTMLGFLKRLIPYMGTVMATFFAIYIVFIITAEAAIFMFMMFALVFGFLFVMYYLSQLVAKYYNLGGCGGCFAVVVGFVLWIVLAAAASYVFFESVG